MHRIVPLLATACALLSCASPVHVARCERSLLDAPPPLEPCLRDPDGQAYVMDMARRLADGLIGWRGAPGAAEVTLAFGLDSSVDAVCLGPTEGEVVSRRAPEAVASLEDLPRGPACLSGRTLVLAWESPVVTEQEIAEAKLACRPVTQEYNASIGMCRAGASCSDTRLRGLFEQRDAAFASCVLLRLPLSVFVAGEGRIVSFLPHPDSTPTREAALGALGACESQRDSSAVIECMRANGWEPAL